MNTTAKTFKDLIVWQKAHSFVLSIYQLTTQLPKDEQFGLTSQIRRASVSIPANIAEGFPRRTAKDKLRFYNIAKGSLEEVRYYLILIQDLNYANTNVEQESIVEISKLLNAYSNTIK